MRKHGWFRETVVAAVVSSCGAGVIRAAEEAGFVPIFDGRTLNGWDGDPTLWRVEDGAITGRTSAEAPIKVNNFLIWRQGEVDDFELRVEFRMAGGNSGIQYRSFENEKEWGRWVVGGYQADIDDADAFTGSLYGERYRGMLATRGEKTVIGEDHKPKVVGQVGDREQLKAAVRHGDWNEYRIVARGNRSVLAINGRVMAECTDDDKAERRRGGILAFQLHVGPPMKVQFRNIRLKRLPMEGAKKVVFVAGTPGHGYGEHEHNAGCVLLARLLNENLPGTHAVVYRNGWPADPTAFDNADAIVLFADGAGGNPVLPHLEAVEQRMKRGVGLAVLHYALDVPAGKGRDCLLRWIGGYYETFWSVNPYWPAEFKTLPEHPITRGVRPFSIADEWYYHMRFAADMKGVTPILTAVPPDETRKRPDGPYSGNEHVRKRMGMPEHVAWAFERADGGRGFGFTGGHYQWNWGHDDLRRLLLNAIAWVAKAEVPAGGVPSKTPTVEELETGLDDKPKPKDFDRDAIRRQLQQWNGRPTTQASPLRTPVYEWFSMFDGKALGDWRPITEGVFEGHGTVEVKDGTIALARGRLQTGITWKGEFPRDNYEVALEAMRTDGSDFFCGLTFPVGAEPCTLIVGGWGGSVVGLSNVDDQHAAENETTRTMEFENNRWYTVRLRVTPAKIQAWIDEQDLIDLAREKHRFAVWWEQERVRPFGVATWDTGAALRNIRVRKLG